MLRSILLPQVTNPAIVKRLFTGNGDFIIPVSQVEITLDFDTDTVYRLTLEDIDKNGVVVATHPRTLYPTDFIDTGVTVSSTPMISEVIDGGSPSTVFS